MDALVCHQGMRCIAVCIGKHSNGLDAQLFGRADDPAGDLPAVGDKQFLKQGLFLTPDTGERVETRH